ncbi:MAG: hypothetical protein HYS77_14625 [Candidatus Rokubacteria bacterium]|nr:hypothetical protein [Candidatus Rokubacteria bacterium]
MKALRHRTVLFFLVMAALGAGWEVFLTLTMSRRIDAAVEVVLGREPVVNVAVTLGFVPEDFHVRLFQEYGVVSGVRGTTVLLGRVGREDVRRIGRYYWVRRIALQ